MGSRAELQLKQVRAQAGDFFVKLVGEQGAARCSFPFGWSAISLLFRKNALMNDRGQRRTVNHQEYEVATHAGSSLFAQTTDGMR